MSGSPSAAAAAVAAALLSELSEPAQAGARYHLSSAHGVELGEILASLLEQPGRDVAVTVGAGAEAHTLRAVTLAGGGVLIPYLIDVSGAPTANSGSDGFAATLRTQFHVAAPAHSRTLLILGTHLAETIRSATQDAAALGELSFGKLAERVALSAQPGLAALPPLPRRVARHFAATAGAGLADRAGALNSLARFMARYALESETVIGAQLFELPTYVADPDVSRDPDHRLASSWQWRKRLDAWLTSPGASLETRLRGRLGAGPRALDTLQQVLAAERPFGLDYSAFSLNDLRTTGSPISPLAVADPGPVRRGAILALRSGTSLTLWLPAPGGEVVFALSRPAEPGEQLIVRFGRTEMVAALDSSRSAAAVTVTPELFADWRFGWLETRRTSPRAQTMQRLALAVIFSDGEKIAVESSLTIDPATSSFAAASSPTLTTYNRSGAEISTSDPAGNDGEANGGPGARTRSLRLLAPRAGEQDVPAVPVTGQESDEAPEPGDQPPAGDNPEDPQPDPGDAPDPEPSSPSLSIPHWLLLRAGRRGAAPWPAASVPEPPSHVAVFMGGRPGRIEPRVPELDDSPLRLERAILEHPEWLASRWDERTGTLTGLRGFPEAGHGLADVLHEFAKGRRQFFAVARAAGSVYCIDPESEAAVAYVSAYAALLSAFPRDGIAEPGLIHLLQCDLTEVAGRVTLLMAPTSPLAVAFHGELASRAGRWIVDDDVPAASDLRTIGLRHALPLLHHHGDWYESASSPEALLWRRYVPLAVTAPGTLERNSNFIQSRLQFFLDAHPALNDPRAELAVTFADPGDGTAVIEALSSFYRGELDRDSYTLPRLAVRLAGGNSGLGARLGELLAGGRADDEERLVRARCRITKAPSGPGREFSHLTFLFTSPGGRRTRPVRIDEQSSTTYVDGLACAPGRVRIPDQEPVFATGTFATEPGAGASPLQRIIYRGLELAGGQAGELLHQGFTRMPVASVRLAELDAWYENSAWVVHLDRMVGLEAFTGEDAKILEYEERADPEQPGFDGITATRRIRPYLASVQRALMRFASVDERGARYVVRQLEAVSGRWALQLLRRTGTEVRERMGTACAVHVLDRLEEIFAADQRGHDVRPQVTVLVALEEMLSGRPSHGPDDLLAMRVIDSGPGSPVRIQMTPLVVKFSGQGQGDYADGAERITEVGRQMADKFGLADSARQFRGRDLAELIRAASTRNSAFGLGVPLDGNARSMLSRVSTGDYEIGIGHWRGGQPRIGAVVSVEMESASPRALADIPARAGHVDVLRLGHPYADGLLTGADVPRPRDWPRLELSPPAARSDSDRGSRPGPAVPTAAETAPGAAAVPGNRLLHLPHDDALDGEIVSLASRLNSAFARYGLEAEPFDPRIAQAGPTVIRMRTRALGRLAITDVERRSRDISREIEAQGEVLIGDEPGYVTVDVPRTEQRPLPLADLLPALTGKHAPGSLEFIAGVAPSGEIRVADLARLPHLLVAGATGSGKSVFLRGLLVEILRTHTPEQLRLIIVDPKRLDFAPFARAPHTHGGSIVFDPDDALSLLQSTLEAELVRRQPILEDAGVSSAAEFYEAGGALESLPQLVILVDEFADLILAGSDRRAFSELIQRYAQLTRAYGIYLVLSTQRPSVDVITGSIKANLTARVAFAVPSARDSMTVIDRGGAEDLLGNGDLLFYRNGRVERLQAPLVATRDVGPLLQPR